MKEAPNIQIIPDKRGKVIDSLDNCTTEDHIRARNLQLMAHFLLLATHKDIKHYLIPFYGYAQKDGGPENGDLKICPHYQYVAEAKTLEIFTRNRGNCGLTYKEVKIVLKGIFSGLELLHETDIIHCDMKPDNVFFIQNAKGRIKKVLLGDFEIATQRNAPPHYHQIGTAVFAPPEAMTDIARVPSFDVYSLSITTVAFLLAQHYPDMINGCNLTYDCETVYKKKLHDPFYENALEILQLHHKNGEKIVKILKKATSYKPEDRFQSVQEFRSALFPLLTKDESIT
ncbi:MAG: hypothetical protein UX04_C0010G0014 [Microgenomates group bacterium GW2011_GWF2_45_18]|nr:MAG: hypothetical protein UW18_C0013G0001 [Microgenomates group bacterium GW2011_GWF1_44_10]KKU01361.1 MAG: hypothetical protein UX04_C0010G0014 [Microgenomates group bacterium GW2011_GWF2_45_18]HAU99362.1 hypothetical protein [Candidatus Paceibacterota bacterium]HAX01340.1 hypothetical protein [Candidatus Paceibacterota bacterium]